MSDDRDGLRIPEDEADLIEMMEEFYGRELTEHEKNRAITQARLVGEL